MAAKQLLIPCTHEQRMLLAEVIRFYALAAYPPGGSECVQAAREALLNTAAQLDNVPSMAVEAVISRRIRTNLKAALDYYAAQHVEQQQTDQLMDILVQA